MKHFEIIEHTADIGIKAFGATLEEAFAGAGEAMFQLITDNAPIGKTLERKIILHSIDREGLLVRFLSELAFINDSENLVFAEFSVRLTGDNGLEADGRGEIYNWKKHGKGRLIKGVTYNQMEIVEGKGGGESWVRVVFDI